MMHRTIHPLILLALVATAAAAQDAKVWDNYDFVPGSKVLYYTDFSDEKVGEFPSRLKHIRGPMDVVERDGVKMLRSVNGSEFLIRLRTKLPQRFTLELDLITRSSDCCSGEELAFEGTPSIDRGPTSAHVLWHHQYAAMLGSGQDMGNSTVKFSDDVQALLRGKLVHLRVQMDGVKFKMYTNERRTYNLPELEFVRDTLLRVFLGGVDEETGAVFLTRVRLAESTGEVLYDALASKGRWSTQGILFETGKSVLQPESRPVLKEIAAAMKSHPELKILVEGHTDNVGAAAVNLALSAARAAAVKAALVTDFAIDAARITPVGLGDTKPAAPNATPEGRAQNRRVEVVKQG